MPAVYNSLATAAGTTLSIATTAPANHDAVGFDGITPANWTVIGAVVNTGGFPRASREFEDVSLLDGTSMVIAQAQTMESIEVECVYQPANTGQVAVAAAADGKTMRWFRWVLPNGTKIYCAGYVTGYSPNAATSDDYVSVTFTIKPVFDATGKGPVISTT